MASFRICDALLPLCSRIASVSASHELASTVFFPQRMRAARLACSLLDSRFESHLSMRRINESDQKCVPSDCSKPHSLMQSSTNFMLASASHCICIANALPVYLLSGYL